MPLFDLRCRVCGHTFEAILGSNDKNPTCAHRRESSGEFGDGDRACGGETERLVSRSSFVLKGGGWYSDGYGK